MKINNVVFAKNEVLKMVMKKAHFILEFNRYVNTMSEALKRAWSDVKKEIADMVESKNQKTISYSEYKNNPKYSNLQTLENSYNAKRREITVILNSVKEEVKQETSDKTVVVKEQFLRNKLSTEERFHIQNLTATVEKETVKAVFVKFVTELGNIKFWVPKVACLEVN